MLPHMLAHYRSLGVESFLVHAHGRDPRDPVIEQVTQIARDFGCAIASITLGEWLHSTNRELYNQTLRSHREDWFLIADQDELQVYPRDLISILDDCARQGYDYIEGCFLDRFARDGSFPAVSANESI